VFYFAYGSLLDPAEMRETCRTHREAGIAALVDHRLSFPRFSRRWGGGVASVDPFQGHSVWGALYEISDEDLGRLDRREGFDPSEVRAISYDRKEVTVLRPSERRPADSRLAAWTYVARRQTPSLPTRLYLETILSGAHHHHLPPEYIAELAAIETRPDNRPNS
jgi:gamma-glutamylcyclotransferase (GGCT)/AIG2-like uncharacterized protein YtfP